MKDKFKTDVLFRQYKDGDIIALFPHNADRHGNVESYMHIGQHSMADYGGVQMCTTPAKENEYTDLKSELKSIGYNLRIIKRRNYDKYLKALYEARKS
jgi:hypothetical protein